jgi:eukaryotic-like serine/threonine-protein kinase
VTPLSREKTLSRALKSLIGEVVGSYRLVQKLGQGGMGEVYLADHLFIARRAALKFLLSDLSNHGDIVNRFFTEARAASMIQHPGIVEVLDCQVGDDGRAYIVMEALTGESLAAYLRRIERLDADLPAVLAISAQLASALAAAHAQGIVHRDLKPDNLFLHVASGRDLRAPILKVLDFGVAKLVDGPSGTNTQPGLLMGTPSYMSPEQCRGSGPIDLRSDVYSFGCILFELLCGRPPFLSQGMDELIMAHISKPPPDPAALSPGLQPWLRQLVLACLAKDPEARPQSMSEVLDGLTAANAPLAIVLATPIEPAAQAAKMEGSPTPTGQGSPPRLMAATTPLPAAQVLSPRPVGKSGGTRLLPSGSTPDTLQRVASEVVGIDRPRRGAGNKILLATLGVGAVAAITVAVFVKKGGVDRNDATTATPVLEGGAQPAAATLPAPPPAATPSPAAPAPSQLTGPPPGASIPDTQPAALPRSKRIDKAHRNGAKRNGSKGFDGFDDL